MILNKLLSKNKGHSVINTELSSILLKLNQSSADSKIQLATNIYQ
ncbi:hypothetical protein A1OE_1091 [Candidatus Endolissoclinum faulkneri L2]|uniref:Uncharacterized protein n=1 Tax=Candidatus Endolissoclinum faulkneri L2 TaxID=1193729 RepID=K7YRU3_9PROT|nr:hypothetical protein A1OE_1091 [Candidatus Endolissoclinum faulkneri L2]